MNRTRTMLWAMLVLGLVCVSAGAQDRRIGGGVHYWRTLDRIKDDNYKLDDSGIAWLVSYQFAPLGLFRIQADVEIFPSGFGGFDTTTFAPQAYVVVGSGLYAALGVGVTVSDGDLGDDPFYALRAGFDMGLLPGLRLDIHANYRFLDWNDIKELDQRIKTDTVTLGAVLRLAF